MLNGRSPSDTQGHATCRHQGKRTVLDLAIVPATASADVRVMGPPQALPAAEGNYHFPVYATVRMARPPNPSPPPDLPDDSLRRAAVDLTPAQLLSFRNTCWDDVHEYVSDIEGALVDESASQPVIAADAGDTMFSAFEAGVHARLRELVGHEIGLQSVKGSRPPRLTSRLVVKRQP